MIDTLLNVVYILTAIAMIVLILLQRGAGASAGSGFGAGASGTVFGARGSANFLSTATKWLAVLFFGLSLFMTWQTNHRAKNPSGADLGVMADIPAAPVESSLSPAPTGLPAAVNTPQVPVIAPVAPISASPVEQKTEEKIKSIGKAVEKVASPPKEGSKND